MSVARLAMEKVRKQFKQGATVHLVLNNVSVCFEQGNTYAITGVSGVGKSTFMHLLAGLDTPDSGIVLFNEQPLNNVHKTELSKFFTASVGLVFQLPYLIKELSVLENVILKGLIQGMQEDEAREKGLDLLRRVGLELKADSSPSSLSGGQQQRIAILRAIFNEPVFLLADEPTGSLDEKTGREIVDLLLSCRDEWGMGIVVSSHDAYVAQSMETVFQLKDGTLLKK